MNLPAFTTTFTGAVLTSRPNISSSCTLQRPSPSITPTAILGSRATPSTFSTSQTMKTYTVKVMQKDRCTLVEVDNNTDLRRALLDANVDLYTLGGKLRNCGGAGQCGTCLLAVEDGMYNMNGRTAKEQFLLEDKPDSWRLACRTKVHGDCTVRTKPRQ